MLEQISEILKNWKVAKELRQRQAEEELKVLKAALPEPFRSPRCLQIKKRGVA
jgi:hypothetical protein